MKYTSCYLIHFPARIRFSKDEALPVPSPPKPGALSCRSKRIAPWPRHGGLRLPVGAARFQPRTLTQPRKYSSLCQHEPEPGPRLAFTLQPLDTRHSENALGSWRT